MIRALLIFAIFTSGFLFGKVRLLTFQYNSPELIELQQKAFKKFMKEDFETVLINDAENPNFEEAIRQKCDQLGIHCVRYNQEWHRNDPLNDQIRAWVKEHPHIEYFLGGFKNDPSQHPSVRHSHLIQYALNHFGYDHDDLIAIVDGDLFPIRPFALREWMKEGDILGIQFYRAPFIAFYPKLLPDVKQLSFGVSFYDNCFQDTGSLCQYYLAQHPEVKFVGYPEKNTRDLTYLSIEELMRLGFREEEAQLVRALPNRHNMEFHLDNHFIHLGSSVTNLLGMKMKLKHIFSWIDI